MMDSHMALVGNGSSNILRHAAICVVNMYGLIESKTETSKVPIMVKSIITAMVETMGPTLFFAKAENASESEATVHNAKNATTKANPKRQAKSDSGMINKPFELRTIKSPVPNTHLATNKERKPNHKVIIKV